MSYKIKYKQTQIYYIVIFVTQTMIWIFYFKNYQTHLIIRIPDVSYRFFFLLLVFRL